MAPGRSAPQAWTSTSITLRSSRARYSTWTPAPPYTSGGYSRVRSATRRSVIHADALADHDDAPLRNDEALAVAVEVDADLDALPDADVLVQDRVADDGMPRDVDAVH